MRDVSVLRSGGRGMRRRGNRIPLVALAAFAWNFFACTALALESSAALPPDDGRTLASLIARLDDDNFDVRNAAAQQLIAMGDRIIPELNKRLQSRPAPTESPELRQGVKKVLTGLERLADAKSLEEATGDFEKIVAEAPLHYLPPNPIVDKRLDIRVSFTFVDTPLETAAEYMIDQTHAIFFIDPAVLASGPPPISLRVTDMKASLALQWIARLLDCKIVTRGRVTVITTNQRARRLRLCKKVLQLPAQQETPWSLEETRALAQDLAKWTLLSDVVDEPIATVTEAGKIEMVADWELLAEIESAVSSLGHAESTPVRFDKTVQDFMTRMSRPIPFSFDTSTQCGDAAVSLGQLTGIAFECDEGIKDLHEKFTTENASGFEILSKLCAAGNVLAYYSIYDDKNHIQLKGDSTVRSDPSPCVLDYRPALKAGASAEALEERIDAILADARALNGGTIPEAALVRGRRVTRLDVFSAYRAATVLETAAQTGKVPELPPLPGFLKNLLPAKPDPAAAPESAPGPGSPADE
jgi:hypothetical protein